MKAFPASSDAQGAGAPVAQTGRVARGPFQFLRTMIVQNKRNVE
jgi:hypothetical protein